MVFKLEISPPGGTLHVRIDLAYHGKDFAGFQVQPDQITVQGELQNALQQLFKEKVTVFGAGRTDSGVHAKQMVCHFRMPKAFEHAELLRALNSLTPKSLLIFDLKEVNERFHARYTPHCKTYRYRFDTGSYPDPLNLDFYHHVKGPELNFNCMEKAIQLIIGTHEFASFTTTKNDSNTTIRTVKHLELLHEDEHKFSLIVEGNGFLHNMVRIFAGTLLDVGWEKIQLTTIEKALTREDMRYDLGPTLPANGLCLEKIVYGEEVFGD